MLIGVCSHSGITDGGHYIAHCLSQHNGWHQFNDENVYKSEPPAPVSDTCTETHTL